MKEHATSFTDILQSESRHESAPFKCMALTGDSFRQEDIPDALKQIDGGVAVICFEGSLDISIDEHRIEMQACDLCTFLSGNLFTFRDCSPDFKGILVVVAPYFIANLDAHISITYFLHSQISPVISLPEEEMATLKDMLRLTESHAIRTSHPYHKEILKEILMIVLYELCAIYQKQNKTTGNGNLRNEKLLKEFLRLVEENYIKERTLRFYAERLSLTPKYLSSAIKKFSGHSAAEWIDYILLLNAKSILRSSNMTIQQVSDYLNFPNASFFGKFFKRHTGMTPREYKTQP